MRLAMALSIFAKVRGRQIGRVLFMDLFEKSGNVAGIQSEPTTTVISSTLGWRSKTRPQRHKRGGKCFHHQAPPSGTTTPFSAWGCRDLHAVAGNQNESGSAWTLAGTGCLNSSDAFFQAMRRTSSSGIPSNCRRHFSCEFGQLESACG